MTVEEIQNIIRNYIGKANVKDALKLIEQWTIQQGNTNAKNLYAMIKADWEQLQRDDLLGFADKKSERQAKIRYNILHFQWTTDIIMNKKSILPLGLNILFMGANPFKNRKAPLHETFYEIQKRLEAQASICQYTLKEHLFARKADFRDKILNEEPKPNIIHFTGLGKLTKIQKERLCKATQVANWELFGGLIFHDRDYKSIESVNALDIGGYFKYFIEDEKLPIHTVVLSACYSAPQAKAIAQYVPYVIGMRKEIEDSIAMDFSEAFYSALANGKNVTEAFKRAKTFIGISKAKELVSFYINNMLQINQEK